MKSPTPIEKAHAALTLALQQDPGVIQHLLGATAVANGELSNHPHIPVNEDGYVSGLGLLNGILHAVTGQVLTACYSAPGGVLFRFAMPGDNAVVPARATPEYDGPSCSDGCDHEGSAGGCERAGHQPGDCFRIGDTVRLTRGQLGAGCEGVVTALEIWVDKDHFVLWDGIGERPAAFPGSETRCLVYIKDQIQPHTAHTMMHWLRRAHATPHTFPFCYFKDLELVSRPQARQLNDSGALGSWVAHEDGVGNTFSDSAGGCMRNMAELKRSHYMTKEGAGA